MINHLTPSERDLGTIRAVKSLVKSFYSVIISGGDWARASRELHIYSNWAKGLFDFCKEYLSGRKQLVDQELFYKMMGF